MDFEVQGPAITSEISNYELERNKPMPSLNHSIIQANLIFEIKSKYRDKYRVLSELSLDLDKWPSVPDISIFPMSEMDPWNDEITVKEPPLCVIEILSPTQSLSDLTTKAKGYFQHGVKSCWIVLPTMSNIYVYSSPSDYTIFRATETLVDEPMGISFPLAEVFK